jgi:hypothetical protein
MGLGSMKLAAKELVILMKYSKEKQIKARLQAATLWFSALLISLRAAPMVIGKT